MTELILLGISALALICSVPIWLSKHGGKPRAGIKMGKEVFDASFWITIISFVVFLISVYSLAH